MRQRERASVPRPDRSVERAATWSSDDTVAASWRDDDSLDLSVEPLAGNRHATVVLQTGAGTLNLRVRSSAEHLRVEIADQFQSVASIGHVQITGSFARVEVSAPIWVGDPTELGTVEITSLSVARTRSLALGGDELHLRRLALTELRDQAKTSVPDRDDDNRYDKLHIIDDSKVFLERAPVLAVSIGNRAYLQVHDRTSVYLGRIGIDAELAAAGAGPISVEDWKVHLCSGRERIHFTRIEPFGYSLLRRVRARLHETDANLIGTYEPAFADRVPLDVPDTAAASTDWIYAHHELMSSYCHDPALLADSRWLTYEDRRRRATAFSVEWFFLNAVMRPLGHGLKLGPPLRAWLAAMIAVVGVYAIDKSLRPDMLGGQEAWWRGIRLWTEALFLPASFFSLAAASGNSVLILNGTGLRIARVIVSVPFAALLLAAQARLRLPKFSDAKP